MNNVLQGNLLRHTAVCFNSSENQEKDIYW